MDAGPAHVLTDTVRPTAANGCLYVCTVAGTSGTTEPAWPTTVGATVVDGSLTWNTVPSNQEVFQVEDIGVTTIGSDYATTAVLAVNSAVGAQRQLRFLTNGSQRWGILTGSTPEPGLNVGSDFLISRYSDGGINLGAALTITRATGVVTLATAPVITALPINAANDAAAAAAGVQPGGEYRNGSIKMIRVA